MTLDHIIGLLPSILAAIGVYAAVRADLARLAARTDAHDKLHEQHSEDIGALRQWLHSIRGDL